MEIEEYLKYRDELLIESQDSEGFINESSFINSIMPILLDSKLVDSEDFTETYFLTDFENQVLKIKKGDTYNGVELEKRIADNSDPDAFDLTNLYQNNGYLFSTITPVEVSADGNVIDMEIRVTEGKPAYFKNISVYKK